MREVLKKPSQLFQRMLYIKNLEVLSMKMTTNPQVFLFLSELLGKKVIDLEKREWGKVVDLVVSLSEPYPPVIALLCRHKKEILRLSWKKIIKIEAYFLTHSLTPADFDTLQLKEGELLLKDFLLDKQIVDTHGAKVLRVNDLHFLQVDHTLRLVHVDVGFKGLMRRVGWGKFAEKFFQWFFDYQLKDSFIPWRYVQPISSPDLLRLKISQNKLAQLHPADLADIIEELDVYKRSQVFQSLDAATAAETLEETDPKIQVRLIETLNPAQASDIIEEMSPSEAADLLGDLPKEKAEGILREMEEEIAEDVKELLVHPDEKAGGLMTTSFAALPAETSVQEALKFLRREAENLDVIYYVYIIDAEGHLLGVISLRELLTAEPETNLSNLSNPRVITVGLEEEKEEIADLFAKYGFKAIPVVDEEKRLKGVIPFKNLLEVVAPKLGK